MPISNIREAVLNLMLTSPNDSVTISFLARRLNVSPTERSQLRKIIAQLLSEGVLREPKKACFVLQSTPTKGLSGSIRFTATGHAFFYPDPSSTPSPLPPNQDRVFIPRNDTSTALDGDRVEVALIFPKIRKKTSKFAPSPNEPEEIRGKVTQVISRRSGKIIGTFNKKQNFAWVDCDEKSFSGSIHVTTDSTAQPGQLVVVSIDQWDSQQDSPRGRIIEVLGWPGAPGLDIISVIHRYGLHTSFPDDVLNAAKNTPESIPESEIARRIDWRNHLVITIDPADAKDHDDAIWVEKTPNGWQLAVHIADVSHYIKPDSAMDKEARLRGNSTYLVDRVLPMLPVELSNGICSLKPFVDRLTKCVLIEFSHNGTPTKTTFQDAIIHSRAKLSYEQAQAILDGNPPPPNSDPSLAPMIAEAWKLASTLRKKRFAHGALDLEMPEIRIRLDDHGNAIAAEPSQHCESHQLIEECMLIANEAVGRALRERTKPTIYRIHDDPDAARLLDYSETAKAHGYQPGDLTNRAHIQKLLDASKGTPEEHIIKLGLLKSLKRASYSPDPIGHYGLAKTDYCHFTSPIRRYADLIVHRSLQPLLANPPAHPDRTPSQADLTEIARHISDTERTSADAESESKQIKMFEYLQLLADQHDPHVFHGLITEVRPMGLMVEVPNMGIRGVVKREALPKGRWYLESHRGAWVSSEGAILGMGMQVPLHVESLDPEKRFVDFSVAGEPTSSGTTPTDDYTPTQNQRFNSPRHFNLNAKPHPNAKKSGSKPTNTQKSRFKPSGAAKKSSKPHKKSHSSQSKSKRR